MSEHFSKAVKSSLGIRLMLDLLCAPCAPPASIPPRGPIPVRRVLVAAGGIGHSQPSVAV